MSDRKRGAALGFAGVGLVLISLLLLACHQVSLGARAPYATRGELARVFLPIISFSPQPVITALYVGSSSGGSAGGISFNDEDILTYEFSTGAWSMHFDGSDVGLNASGVDIDAFHISADGRMLLSFSERVTIPDVGSVDDSDIVRFIPTSIGSDTAGSYQLYFDGSDVELADAGEDIDAIGFVPDGRLAISTRGSVSAGGLSSNDEDLIVFTATSLGETTSGAWEVYFDGSGVGLDDGGNDEDVNGSWINSNGSMYLATRAPFSVDGASGDSSDIFTCVPGSIGDSTSCTFSLFWDGSAHGFEGESIDGFAIETDGGHSIDSPDVTISAPADGATFNQGYDVSFSGSAVDSKGGDVTASLWWESSLDGPIGKDGAFSRTDLSAGKHTITAQGTDNRGLVGFDIGRITVFTNATVLVGAGDIAGCGSEKDEETAALLDSIAGTVFTVGDNVYPDGTDIEFTDCYDSTWGRHKARTRPTPGNHEYHVPGASGYFNYFGAAAGDPDKGYYSYQIGDWHIVALNSECSEVGGCGIDSPQGQWLQADLAANPSTCTLAYWHEPRFSSGIRHGGNAEMQDFWLLLYDSGADIVLNGHEHNYERFALQDPSGAADPERGIRQIVVGTGGKHLYPFGPAQPNSEIQNSDTFGILKLTLHPTSYDWEFVPIAGSTFTDSGGAPCVGAPAAMAMSHPAPYANKIHCSLPWACPQTSEITTR